MQLKSAKAGTMRKSLRDIQREDTRRRLLVTGRKLFRSKGVDPVSMENIAAKAEVSRANIYLHFAGKPALLEALLEEDWTGQIRLFERLVGTDFADLFQLELWIRQVAEGMVKARDSFVIHRAALGQNPALTIRHQQHRRRLAEIMLQAIDAQWREADELLAREVEAELIVAELEYFATAAALGWEAAQVAAGAALIGVRMQDFAARA